MGHDLRRACFHIEQGLRTDRRMADSSFLADLPLSTYSPHGRCWR